MSENTNAVTGKISSKLADIMMQAKAIGKDSQNQQQGFRFRGIDAVMNHLHPIFAAHGVVILPNVIGERTEERQTRSGGNLIYRILTVQFVFLANDGSSVSCTAIGEGMDSGDKASNKAMAVALKYALTQMLLLPYDEVDPDGETPPESTRKQTVLEPAKLPAVKPDTTKPVTPPAQSSNPDINTADVVLGNVLSKTGESKRGTWTRTYTKASDGEFYSTFDIKLGEMMGELEGQPARLGYVLEETAKGTSRKVVEVRPGTPEEGDANEQDPDQSRKDGALPF